MQVIWELSGDLSPELVYSLIFNLTALVYNLSLKEKQQ